jgi:hypothetical protein
MSIAVTFAGQSYSIPTTGDEDFWGLDLTNYLVALSTHSATGITLAAVGSAPNANGASLSGTTLNLQPASASFPGVLTTGAQEIAGDKTFDGSITALNLSGTNTGDVAITSFSSTPSSKGLNASGQAIFMTAADGTRPGGVSTAAQTFAGAKTFSSSPVFSTATHVRATTSAGATITNNTITTVVFGTESYDTRSEYNPATGEFTAAETGYYLISARAVFTAYVTAASDDAQLYLYVNGSPVAISGVLSAQAALSQQLIVALSTTYQLTAADVVTIRVIQQTGGNRTLLNSGVDNYLTIDRLF